MRENLIEDLKQKEKENYLMIFYYKFKETYKLRNDVESVISSLKRVDFKHLRNEKKKY